MDSDDEDALPGALFRNVFRSGEEVDEQKVLLLADYVYSQIENLDSIDDECIISGDIEWLPMPGVDASRLGKDDEMSKWRQALSEDGRKYWWNVETRKAHGGTQRSRLLVSFVDVSYIRCPQTHVHKEITIFTIRQHSVLLSVHSKSVTLHYIFKKINPVRICEN